MSYSNYFVFRILLKFLSSHKFFVNEEIHNPFFDFPYKILQYFNIKVPYNITNFTVYYFKIDRIKF